MRPSEQVTVSQFNPTFEEWEDTRPATVEELVAALREAGAGEVVETHQDAFGRSVLVMAGNPMADAADNLKSGSYLVVRIDGET